MELAIPAHGRTTAEIEVPGVTVSEYWARVMVNADPGGAQLNAFVSAADITTIVAENMGEKPVRISGVFSVECGLA